jgi:3-carboxy-cis,cis-muconate cycloisomerase
VGARLADSALYSHLWGTAELRAVFDERARLQSWMDVLAALALAQSELGIIPRDAAEGIARHARVEELDLDAVAEETRAAGHSTLGLIRGWQAVLPPEAGEWVYYGATVQDVTDTWTALAMRASGALVWRDLRAIEGILLELAERHKDTPMAGRTHGQPGAPITFGLKAAGWADEIGRHLERLAEGSARWLVGQLGGAVGTLSFFGSEGLELRSRFCRALGLGDPVVPWLSARDRVAEFGCVLAMVAATCARIGNEVYQLQRPEIDELREAAPSGQVGSITMPHKRNPEASEHLVTLARLVRAQAAVLLEGMVGEHERDGRAWKAEWIAFPEVCLLTGVALQLTRDLVARLEIDDRAMRRNLDRHGGWTASERVLAALAPAMGKHRAQATLQRVLGEGRRRGLSLVEALLASEEVTSHLGAEVVMALVDVTETGQAPAMVEAVAARARVRREAAADTWP